MLQPSKLPGWEYIGSAMVGIALFVIALTLDRRYGSGGPAVGGIHAVTVVWLSLVAVFILSGTWYVASRERRRTARSRRPRSSRKPGV